MLDAFIINRIREHRDERGARQVPLRIEVPQPPPEEQPRKEDAESERGVAIIDFEI